MSQTTSPGVGRPYGLERVCRVLEFPRSTIYAQQARDSVKVVPLHPARRGPKPKMSDADLLAAIRADLKASPFVGEGHRKVWARLRLRGVRTSLRRVLRLMGQHDLLAPARAGSPRGPRNHDGTIIPDTMDTMWGTDMTAAFTVEHGQVAVFVAVDHCSAE